MKQYENKDEYVYKKCGNSGRHYLVVLRKPNIDFLCNELRSYVVSKDFC